MEVNTKVTLSGLTLDNPVIPASGTFGFGKEYVDFYDINILGSISIKGTTVQRRKGNPQPRIAECYAGLINSVGLENPGMENVIQKELKDLEKIYRKPVIANISGFSVEEYVTLAREMDKVDNVGIIEVNISCPNVDHGGLAFGTNADNVRELTMKIKEVTTKPVYMKLSPNVTDIKEIARAAQEGGADGISLINTLMGMRIDINRRKPVIANKKGGFSGPAIFPVALRMVYEVYEATNLPIIGIGGISSAEDVIEMMMAGATAVQIGAANLINPMACKEIIEELPQVMEKLGINSLDEIIGIAHKDKRERRIVQR